MPWLYFALSAVCFTIAFRTLSLGIAAICLLLAFGLMLAGALALASARIQSRAQSAAALLGPAQAAAMQRRREQGPEPEPAVSPPASSGTPGTNATEPDAPVIDPADGDRPR